MDAGKRLQWQALTSPGEGVLSRQAAGEIASRIGKRVMARGSPDEASRATFVRTVVEQETRGLSDPQVALVLDAVKDIMVVLFECKKTGLVL